MAKKKKESMLGLPQLGEGATAPVAVHLAQQIVRAPPVHAPRREHGLIEGRFDPVYPKYGFGARRYTTGLSPVSRFCPRTFTNIYYIVIAIYAGRNTPPYFEKS